MPKLVQYLCLTVFVAGVSAGCARTLYIEPTREEMAAARKFKQTLAIIDVEDEDSDIAGIGPTALSKLEEELIVSFNLVERSRIESVLAEREFIESDLTEDYAELGRLLNADFIAFGTTYSSATQPQLRSKVGKDDDGNFWGSIWLEYCGRNETGLKIVDVKTGLLEYAQNKTGSSCKRGATVKYKEADKYHKALAGRRLLEGVVAIANDYSRLSSQYSAATLGSLNSAMHQIGADLRRKFAQSGEILEIVSKKEVLVNLGSAYGVRPGDHLLVYEERATIVDPKTGLEITPKVNYVKLKVTKVTSGLTCVAKASKKNIRKLRVGDAVYTY